MAKPPKRLFGLPPEAREKLVKRMIDGRSNRRLQTPGGEVATGLDRGGGTVPAAYLRFDQLPGYREFDLQRAAIRHLGVENPFFRLHERAAHDTAVIEDREYINFASYNYLGFCGHEAVARAAKVAIDRYGTSASASRPVSGERPPQRQLERALAEMHGVEACAVFVSGWATNVTTLGHLFGSKDLILHDALIHNSTLQGAMLSGARRRPFPRNDFQTLDEILSSERRKYTNMHPRPWFAAPSKTTRQSSATTLWAGAFESRSTRAGSAWVCAKRSSERLYSARLLPNVS